MTKKNNDDDHEDHNKDNLSDSELFRQAASGTRPLKETNKVVLLPTQNKSIRVHRHTVHETTSYPLSDFSGEMNESTADEFLTYSGNGVQQRLFKKLKNGQISIEARLDLHGLTVEHARTALSQFIADSINQQLRCVIIIHGKGSRGGLPVLKSMLNHWLKQIGDILAFSSAQPKDGGTGALYVLLKNKSAQK